MKFSQDKLEERLENVKDLENINEGNSKAINEFYKRLRLSNDVGNERIAKYISAFSTLFDTSEKYSSENFIPKYLILKQASKEEIRDVIFRVQESSYSQWTKNDFKVCLKKFYNTLYEDEIDRPDRVKKILRADFLKKDTNIKNKKEVEALTASEVREMSEQATNKRDSLLPIFLFETGSRIGEITGRDVEGKHYQGVRLKDVELKKKYADVAIETEKNQDEERKKLTLVRSVGLLKDWLEDHPRKNGEDSKLFVTVAQNRKGYPLGRQRMQEILRELASEAGIEKRITNHVFRHSSATYKGTELGWNQQRMMYWHGWNDEKMASKYCKQDEDRIKAQRLEEEGLETTDDQRDNSLDVKECPRCNETVDPFASYCPQCSLALDQRVAQDLEETKDPVKDELIEELKQEVGLSESELEEKIREKVRNRDENQ